MGNWWLLSFLDHIPCVTGGYRYPILRSNVQSQTSKVRGIVSTYHIYLVSKKQEYLWSELAVGNIYSKKGNGTGHGDRLCAGCPKWSFFLVSDEQDLNMTNEGGGKVLFIGLRSCFLDGIEDEEFSLLVGLGDWEDFDGEFPFPFFLWLFWMGLNRLIIIEKTSFSISSWHHPSWTYKEMVTTLTMTTNDYSHLFFSLKS